VKAYHKIAIGLGVLLSAGMWYVFVPYVFHDAGPRSPTVIYDRHGVELFSIGAEGFASGDVDLSSLPSYIPEALIASEDRRFYEHGGVDLPSLVRVLFISEGGASTITSQVIKNVYFPQEGRHIFQKGREFILAFVHELGHSKEDILRQYLETAYFGSNIYGIEAAAKEYFNKSPEALSLAEAALLIGVLPNPEGYHPITYREKATARQRVVLRLMEEEGMISSEQRELAEDTTLMLRKPTREITAPHFVMWVLDELEETYPDIREGGYEVHTSLDSYWQQDAEEKITKHLAFLEDKNVTNAALVVMEPQSGEILVMVGSHNFYEPEYGAFNVAIAERQPGSALKPFTYLAAFLQGYGPASIIYDIERSFDTVTGRPYIPKNYNLKVHGPVTIRNALGSSLNIPAVAVLEDIGLQTFHDLLEVFGMTFDQDPDYYGLGITLGGGEVTLLDLTHAYSMLANGGIKTPTTSVTSLRFEGEDLEFSSGTSTLLEEELGVPTLPTEIYLINHILRDNSARAMSFGLANRLNIHKNVAVKTGTTKDFRDNWAFGYTPDMAVGVWVGNNDNTAMEGVTGITGSIPILHDFFRTKEEIMEAAVWKEPETFARVELCELSGLQATDLCHDKVTELFAEYHERPGRDTWYQTYTIDSRTGTLVNDSCLENAVQKTFVVFPPELLSWAQSVNYPLPPVEYCDGSRAVVARSARLSSPEHQATYLFASSEKNKKIPIRLDGIGFLTIPITIEGEDIPIDAPLPHSLFYEVTKEGVHTIEFSGETREFFVEFY